jgi:hypothetical protein
MFGWSWADVVAATATTAMNTSKRLITGSPFRLLFVRINLLHEYNRRVP